MEYKMKETNQEIKKLFPAKGLRILYLTKYTNTWNGSQWIFLFLSLIVASEVLSLGSSPESFVRMHRYLKMQITDAIFSFFILSCLWYATENVDRA